MNQFPDYIRRQLDQPPPSAPGRHEAWAKLSYQMVGEGIPDDVIFRELRAWIPDRDKGDREIRDLINGAHKRNPRPAAGARRSPAEHREEPPPKVKPFRPTGKSTALPTELAGTTPAQFLDRLFYPDDLICLSWPNKHGKPTASGDRICTTQEWLRRYADSPESFKSPHGVWFEINPPNSRTPGHGQETARNGKQIADYRHCLIELEVPKSKRAAMTPEEIRRHVEEYFGCLVQSGLPIAATYTSADASIHALVKTEAKDRPEWEERRDKIYSYCADMAGFDPQNKDACRLSRLPGALRGDKKQTLLTWGIGAAGYLEWEDTFTPRLFEISDLSKLMQEDLPIPPVLIDGWLHKGCIAMLTGSMKTNKSWTMLDAVIALAMGLEWFGRQCRQCTVLYFDAEISRPFWQKRFRVLCEQRDLDPIEVAKTRRILPVFIAGKNITIKSLNKELHRRFERGDLDKVDLIIIDPIYQLYEEDWKENDNSDIAKLGKELHSISEYSGIGTLFAHHHTKGSQEGKRDIEKASGGGSFGRFISSSLAITHIGDEDSNKYTLGWTMSHFPSAKQQVAIREGCAWTITDEDPKEASKKHFTLDQLMEVLPNDGMTGDEWQDACKDIGMSWSDFRELRPKAKRAGRVDFSKLTGRWTPSVSELEARRDGEI